MKAITTKYYGPTNTKGSRVMATDEDGNRVSLSWDCALNSSDNHDAAAKALCVKMDWTQFDLVRGALKTGYVYVTNAPSEFVAFTDAEHTQASSSRMSEWTKAKVGCHWSNGDYSISTYTTVGGAFDSGYVLYKRHKGEIGRHKTFNDADRAMRSDVKRTGL